MSSTLTWLDHDSEARERSLRILALYREKESRDELGIGSIRDALADQLFPGTSTIQTRLAYMLFVPWIYQRLESRRVPSDRIRVEAQRMEAELVAPLVQQGDKAGQEIYGVIGRVAKSELKRFPSSVYWAGLGRWGIRRLEGSQEQYHRSVDSLYRRLASRRKRDDDEWADEGTVSTWHPKLPDPPQGFPGTATFVMRDEDASFLSDRIQTSCAGSLLAWLVQHPNHMDCDFPWLKPDIAQAPESVRVLLEHARCFSLVMHGASLLYNLQLAGLSNLEGRVEEYRAALDEWAGTTGWSEFDRWKLDEFFNAARDSEHAIPHATEDFVRQWIALAQAHQGVVAEDPSARELVRHREQALKKGRSRFTNHAALKQWSGASGVTRLDYRWGTVKTFLADLGRVEGKSHA